MTSHRPSGPRRSRSVSSYLRQTRLLAILALAAFVGGAVSDAINEAFWERHALLAGLVSSAVVVMLSVAVINEVLERSSGTRADWCGVQNPSDSFTKIAVMRPGAITLLMTRRLFTPLGTP